MELDSQYIEDLILSHVDVKLNVGDLVALRDNLTLFELMGSDHRISQLSFDETLNRSRDSLVFALQNFCVPINYRSHAPSEKKLFNNVNGTTTGLVVKVGSDDDSTYLTADCLILINGLLYCCCSSDFVVIASAIDCTRSRA